MKKILCVLLCAVLLLGVLVSCRNVGETPDAGNDGTESTSQNAGNNGDQLGEDSSETETTRKQDITKEDFSQGGVARDFNMMVRVGRYDYLYTEKDSVDHVTHGVFTRNSMIEKEYGIKFKIYEPASPAGANNSQPAGFITALSASTGEYDLAVPDYWWLLEHQGFFINLFDRDELGFNQGGLKQDYWYTSWNDNTTVNNKLYTVVGDAALEILYNIEVIYYNKAMTESLSLDMYELVENREWTIDKMFEIGKNFSKGHDTETTDDDAYALIVDNHSTAAMMYSSGIKLTEIDEYGAINLIADSRFVNTNIHEKLKENLLSSHTYWDNNTARSNLGTKTNLFVNGNSTFYANCLYVGSNIVKAASDDFEFGILPAPLYEADTDYISTAYGVSVFGIPKTSVDLHFAAVILDAYNYYSWNTVVSGFFDSSMKAQLAAGSKDAKMLDIARNNLYFDFAWILQGGDKLTVHNAYQSSLASKDKELTSSVTSAMEKSVPALGDIMLFYTQD